METAVLKVGGMTCGGCARSVTNVLQALPGVQKPDVLLEPGQATVSFDAKKIDVARLRKAIEDAGYKAQ